MIINYSLRSEQGKEYSPEKYITKFAGRIEIFSDDMDEEEDLEPIEIGEITGYLINNDYARINSENIFHIFDDYSTEFSTYYTSVFDTSSDLFKNNICQDDQAGENILLIDDVIIYPNYRGREFGLYAILQTIKTFAMNYRIILIQTLPLQYHESKDITEFKDKIGVELLLVKRDIATDKIVLHWKKIGFSRITKSPLCYIDMKNYRLTEYLDKYE